MPTATSGDRPPLTVGTCDPAVRHVGVTVTGAAAGLDADDVEVERSHLAGLVLDGGRVTRLALSECTVRAVSLVEVDLSDGRWDRVTVEGSRAAGCVVDGGRWEGVDLDEVRAPRLSARQVTWRGVTWRDADLSDLDLSGARLDRVRFERCTVTDAEFAGAAIRHAQFVDCDLSGARTVAALRGATVDSATLASLAGALAAAVGVRISPA